jgi:hypothetical protein
MLIDGGIVFSLQIRQELGFISQKNSAAVLKVQSFLTFFRRASNTIRALKIQYKVALMLIQFAQPLLRDPDADPTNVKNLNQKW